MKQHKTKKNELKFKFAHEHKNVGRQTSYENFSVLRERKSANEQVEVDE